MKEVKIKLGDKVRDLVTGYEGIATSRTEFMNGCVQYDVIGKLKKGEKSPDGVGASIDENNLEVIKKRVINSREYEREDQEKNIYNPDDIDENDETYSGGPMRNVKSMRGY